MQLNRELPRDREQVILRGKQTEFASLDVALQQVDSFDINLLEQIALREKGHLLVGGISAEPAAETCGPADKCIDDLNIRLNVVEAEHFLNLLAPIDLRLDG